MRGITRIISPVSGVIFPTLGLAIAVLYAAPAVFEEIKQVEAMASKAVTEFIQRPSPNYQAEGLRDPFLPYIGEEAGLAVTQETTVSAGQELATPLPSLTVQGIVWGGNFPQAIINNKVVKVGDSMNGVTIKEIGKIGIIVIFEGREIKLPSPGSEGSAKNKPNLPGGENE